MNTFSTWIEEQWRHDREEVALEDQMHDNQMATGSGDDQTIIRWFAAQQGKNPEDLILKV